MSPPLSLLVPLAPPAFAGAVPVNLTRVADAVGGPGFAAGCNGADCFLQIVTAIYGWLQPLFTVMAIFLLVRYGFALVNSQEEEKLQKAKQMIGASITALMLLYLPSQFVTAFYGSGANAGRAIMNPAGSAGIITTEIAGIISWFETLVAVLAVTIIIVSGILAVTSYGKEEAGTQFKRTVGAVVFGIFLIAIKRVILRTFGLQPGALPGAPNIAFALMKIVQVMSSLLGFAGILCAAVILYAGILMTLNFGNEEQFAKAKGIILRAAIGLLAVGASLSVIRFVMTIG